jgi:plasmid maintenance system antidote protein VapI
MDIKVAILKSGRQQYQIAQAIGVSEYRLSRYVHGRAKLQPDQEAKLAEMLGLQDKSSCPVAAGNQQGR